MIKISPPRDWSEMDDAIDRRKNWDLIIFCSHNGVKYFMDRLHFRKLDSRDLFGIKIGGGLENKELFAAAGYSS